MLHISHLFPTMYNNVQKQNDAEHCKIDVIFLFIFCN